MLVSTFGVRCCYSTHSRLPFHTIENRLDGYANCAYLWLNVALMMLRYTPSRFRFDADLFIAIAEGEVRNELAHARCTNSAPVSLISLSLAIGRKRSSCLVVKTPSCSDALAALCHANENGLTED